MWKYGFFFFPIMRRYVQDFLYFTNNYSSIAKTMKTSLIWIENPIDIHNYISRYSFWNIYIPRYCEALHVKFNSFFKWSTITQHVWPHQSSLIHWGWVKEVFFFYFKSIPLLLIIALYYQIKTPIDFWYKWRLNVRSLIQPSETLPVKLTGTYMNKVFWLFIESFISS